MSDEQATPGDYLFAVVIVLFCLSFAMALAICVGLIFL